ncbi:nucleolar protein 7 [Megalops cyprinoides]|uniref:nucleolar protein 7 n=1 Tax=Megalops cyprinoides TaxID=118141 RepID=UPI0018641C99|nr:nucleolar protein 7 [Megalops cyprinoides]
MAKTQHGKSDVPKGKPKSKKMAENIHLGVASSEDDDDEAPEEVTFEDSKAIALRSMKEAIETARREKELLKEKRRKRQELFQEQKKRRLLPDDILEEIDSAVPKKPKASKVQAEKEGTQEEASSSGVEESEKSDAEEEEVEQKQKKKKKRRNRQSLKGNYSVTRVKDQSLASKQKQNALDFIQSHLYGAGSNRTTNNHLLSLQNKRAQKKSAAPQFVDKQWGTEKKMKAEKFKKRWQNQQKVETS